MRLVFVHGGQVLLERGTELHLHAFGFEPFGIVLAPRGGGAGRAHIAHIGAAFNQQTGHQQLRAFIAAQGDAAFDRLGREHAAHGAQGLVAGEVDFGLGHTHAVTNGLQPVVGALDAHRRRTHDGAACGLELADAGGVERVNGRHTAAVERGIQLAPLAGGHHGAGQDVHGGEHLGNDHRVGGEHFTQQGHRGLALATAFGRLHRAAHDFFAGIAQHGTGQHVFGLGVGGHPKTRHIDADDAHAIDLFGQQLQGHTAGGGYAQIDDDDGVKLGWVGLGMDRVADVLKQFAGDQGLGVEGDITHGAARTVEMRGEGQAIHATR